jgi:hydrogenase maturation protease
MPDLREELQQCFQGRVCLMGLGNIDYGDDGFGAIITEAITGRLKMEGEITLAHDIINAGTMPECFIKTIAEKGINHLIFLDTVEFGGTPGSVVFLNTEEISARFPQISTHKISLDLLAKCVEEEGTKAWLLGVQPGSLKFEKGLTPAVQITLEILTELICDVWTSTKETGEHILCAERQPTALFMEEVKI